MKSSSPIGDYNKRVLRDIADFFSFRAGGNLDHLLYARRLGLTTNWENLITTLNINRPGQYHLGEAKREITLLERASHDIIGNGFGSTAGLAVFEIGSGTGDKCVPFVENSNLGLLTLIDYEPRLCDEAHRNLSARSRGSFPIVVLSYDYLRPDHHPPMISYPHGQVLGLVLGGTIANVSALPTTESIEKSPLKARFLHDALTRRFNNVAKLFYRGGELLVTIDTADKKRCLQAYQGPEHAEFIYGALDQICEMFDTNLTPEIIRDIFTHEPRIIEPFGRTRAVCHVLECKKDFDVVVEGLGFKIRRGFANSPINSFKPTLPQLRASAAGAGYTYLKAYKDIDGAITIVRFKKEDKEDSQKGPIAGTGLTTVTSQLLVAAIA